MTGELPNPGSRVVGAREAFLSGRDPADAVRPEIVASWRRSALSGARPDVPALPYSGEFDDRSALHAAATPVLDRLADRLDSTRSAFLLADDTARIVTRWVGDPGLLTMMDCTGSAPGFALREEVCGTNGLGSVVTERRPLAVVGAEHFAERFVGYACHGAPIRHPLTDRLKGVLTFVCRAAESSPLMLAFVQETAGTIEDRLLAGASRSERLLLDAFTAAARRTHVPLVAINDRTLITSPAAAALLDRGLDHAALWETARHAMLARAPILAAGPVPGEFPTAITATPVRDGEQVVGAIVELSARPPDAMRDDPPAGHDDARGRLAARLGGRSPAWTRVLAAAARALGDRHPILITGDPGTGKLELARAIHEQAGGDLHVLNAALAPVDGFAVWLGRIRSAFGYRGTLVLTHLEALGGGQALALAALLDEYDAGLPRLIGTATRQPGEPPPAGPHLDRLAVHRIEPPRLAERQDDIPDLVERLLHRHGATRLRPTPAALRALTAAAWPGNIRQLDLLVRRLAAQQGAGEVTEQDLPAELLTPARRLTRLERLEMEAIVTAIQNAGGDKTQAAADLGLARSTLYRKLREYHLT